MHQSSHTPFDEICRVKESQSFHGCFKTGIQSTDQGCTEDALDALEAKYREQYPTVIKSW
ncbi:hypothetical protein C8R11_105183 [Nitrosomonas aestuarii]|nr:hypothetical protein [Nitrosomonas aestuarii]PTN12220.1 hypothetical protein C8R11_105183 [Nitrosomonas aestuarii]